MTESVVKRTLSGGPLSRSVLRVRDRPARTPHVAVARLLPWLSHEPRPLHRRPREGGDPASLPYPRYVRGKPRHSVSRDPRTASSPDRAHLHRTNRALSTVVAAKAGTQRRCRTRDISAGTAPLRISGPAHLFTAGSHPPSSQEPRPPSPHEPRRPSVSREPRTSSPPPDRTHLHRTNRAPLHRRPREGGDPASLPYPIRRRDAVRYPTTNQWLAPRAVIGHRFSTRPPRTATYQSCRLMVGSQ
jgi:hypothetical protein